MPAPEPGQFEKLVYGPSSGEGLSGRDALAPRSELYGAKPFRFRLYLWVGICDLLVVVAALLAAGWQDPEFGLICALAACLFMTAVIIALYWLYPVRVGPAGIRGFDGVGIFRSVPWDHIRSVSNWGMFLIVRHGRLGTALCIPTLEEKAAFREAVCEFAPAGNVFREYVERS